MSHRQHPLSGNRARGSATTGCGLLLALALGAAPAVAAPQEGADAGAPGPVVQTDVANAILHWVKEFDEGQLSLNGQVLITSGSPLRFVELGVRGGALIPGERYTNFAVLQQLVATAEKHPTRETGEALLALASTGFAGDMFNQNVIMVRDLGHFALLRVDAPAVWLHVFDIATAETADEESVTPDEYDEDRPEIAAEMQAMWSVAAIRLLGMKDQSVFRGAIEDCLERDEDRVRLAAAEAIGFLHRPESLPVISRRLSGESHPMVVFTLVQAVQRILNKHAGDIEANRSELALRMALSRLGQVDWRSDMAIVQLLRNHPLKEAVPQMIALMRSARGETDPILKIVNRNASRFLAAEAHHALRKITGAIIPDDPDLWQEFWEAEKDNLVVRRSVRVASSRTVVGKPVGGTFYGIPVLGADVVFVLDTSGSMKERVKRGPTTGPGPSRPMSGSRLNVARRQTIRAVQGMPKGAEFSIVTFASVVKAWNREPVKAGRSARSTAARILGRLRPQGGTNMFDALLHVLDGEDVGYGDTSRHDYDEIFILSDGQPSGDTGEILQVVRELNKVRKIRINTVFAGAGTGAEFMKQLAEENGGVFVQQ